MRILNGCFKRFLNIIALSIIWQSLILKEITTAVVLWLCDLGSFPSRDLQWAPPPGLSVTTRNSQQGWSLQMSSSVSQPHGLLWNDEMTPQLHGRVHCHSKYRCLSLCLPIGGRYLLAEQLCNAKWIIRAEKCYPVAKMFRTNIWLWMSFILLPQDLQCPW